MACMRNQDPRLSLTSDQRRQKECSGKTKDVIARHDHSMSKETEQMERLMERKGKEIPIPGKICEPRV